MKKIYKKCGLKISSWTTLDKKSLKKQEIGQDLKL